MLEFQPVTLSDYSRLRPFLDASGYRTCDYSVGELLMWRDFFRVEYAVREEILYTRFRGTDGKLYYNLPLGADPAEALRSLLREENKPAFAFVPEEALALFDALGIETEKTEQADFADYLYAAADLSSLAGRKFAGQRNMVHGFARDNPDFTYIPLTPENAPLAADFLRNCFVLDDTADPFKKEEEKKVFEVLENLDAYRFFGSILTAGGKTVGFSLGEQVGDTVFVHIEKADKSVRGAYQTLVNLFAKTYAANARYLNREEDMGDPGLRTSKLSYHPVALLKKFTVKFV